MAKKLTKAQLASVELRTVPEGFVCEAVLDGNLITVVVVWSRCNVDIVWLARIAAGVAGVTEQYPCATTVTKVHGPYKPGLF